MKKIIKLTEAELTEMVYKIISEDASMSELNKLPSCSRKKDEELVGGLVKEVPQPQSRAAAISQSFNQTLNVDVKLYIVKDKKPFCKLR